MASSTSDKKELSATTVFRFLTVIMFIPDMLLALPKAFEHYIYWRFVGMFFCLFSAAVGVYVLVRKERAHKALVFRADAFLFFSLLFINIMQIVGIARCVRSNTGRGIMAVAAYWSMFVLMQMLMHGYFVVNRCTKQMLALWGGDHVCPHCHKTTSTQTNDSQARYSLLHSDTSEYHDDDGETRARRTASFGDRNSDEVDADAKMVQV